MSSVQLDNETNHKIESLLKHKDESLTMIHPLKRKEQSVRSTKYIANNITI